MGSSQSTFASASEAMHTCSNSFKVVKEGKTVLQELRTGIIRIIRKKKKEGKELSEAEAVNVMNNLNLNIYVDNKSKICKIGQGGTLLVINIIGNVMQYEWNDLCGTVEELSEEDIKKFKIAICS